MHYICEECGGVSPENKVCETEGCSRRGQPLAACDCVDGSHHHHDTDGQNDKEEAPI